VPFKKILFPVDFSPRCEAIVPHVKAMCDRFDASLTLLSLVQIPAMAYGSIDSPIMAGFPIEDLVEGAEKGLAQFATTHFPGRMVKTEVQEGEPGLCIAELTQLRDMDLVMMPTRGRGPFRAALLGSVTAKVLHDIHCPVWTEAHCETEQGHHTEWKNIICGIDLNEHAPALIRQTAELAAVSRSTVWIAHATPPPNPGVQQYLDAGFMEDLKIEARKTIAEMQKEAGTDFRVCIESGTLPEVLRHAALNHGGDLVVIGRGAMHQFGGRLRSHVYSVVRDMPCPVLSF